MGTGDIKPIKSPATLDVFAREFTFCWCCGADARQAGWRGLQIHHIAKFGRSDERCNLSRFCATCHDVIEGHKISMAAGVYFPPIDLANVLWLKGRFDYRHYDRSRIATLRHRACVPRIKRPNAAYETLFIGNRGRRWDGSVV